MRIKSELRFHYVYFFFYYVGVLDNLFFFHGASPACAHQLFFVGRGSGAEGGQQFWRIVRLELNSIPASAKDDGVRFFLGVEPKGGRVPYLTGSRVERPHVEVHLSPRGTSPGQRHPSRTSLAQSTHPGSLEPHPL